MAYKFQRGEAVLSGSLIQEGSIEGTSVATTTGDLTSGNNISGSGNLLVGGTVRFDGVADAALDVAADSFYYLDGDNLMKRDTMADYATAIAGDGLAASSGVLAVGVDDTGIEINSDALRLKDNGVTLAKMAGITRGSIISGDSSGDPQYLALGSDAQMLISDGSDLGYVSVSGDATISNSGVLTIAADAVEPSMISIFDDSLAATDTHILIADGTDYSSFAMSGDATLSNAGVLTIAANAVEDSMVNDNVATGLAGDGLSAASGVMAVAVSGAVHVASDKVSISGSIAGDALVYAGGVDSISALHVVADESTINSAGLSELKVADAGITATHLATSVAGNGLSGGAGTALALDLNELSAATVAVANDSIAIIDADDNSSKKESIADLVSAMAGAGLTATNGVLSLAASTAVNAIGDANATLAEGYNYGNAQLTADRTWTLPASDDMQVGDQVVVKAPSDVNDQKIIIARAGSQTIDGFTTGIELEADNSALTLIYAAADTWIIV